MLLQRVLQFTVVTVGCPQHWLDRVDARDDCAQIFCQIPTLLPCLSISLLDTLRKGVLHPLDTVGKILLPPFCLSRCLFRRFGE